MNFTWFISFTYCYWQTNFINLIFLSLAREYYFFHLVFSPLEFDMDRGCNHGQQKDEYLEKTYEKSSNNINKKTCDKKRAHTHTHTIGCYETKIWLSLWIVIIAQIFFSSSMGFVVRFFMLLVLCELWVCLSLNMWMQKR